MARRQRTLRVGVMADLMRLSPNAGHGRVWRRVLAGLSDRVELRPVEQRPDSSAPATALSADVWLGDGHGLPVEVDVPVVAVVHEVGWTTEELRGYLEPSFAEMMAARTAASTGVAAHVLTPSEFSRRQVLEAYGFADERVHVVPYGVDLVRFRPGLTGGRSLVGALGGTEGAPYVLFVASLNPRKNLGAVRRAVSQLARRGFPHVLAVVAADAPDHPNSAELRRFAESELPGAPGRIVSFPSCEDSEIARLMAGADAFCLPSFSEGFGLTALEAMASGAPLIVSDRGPLPEIVNGAGVVVAPTAQAVEDALVAVFSDSGLAARLRHDARGRAEGYGWDRTIDGWLAVLEHAAADRSATAL